tara:strand:- start:1296 stop:1808 length:513 start_codon:yes stop_codon:yes gene_type:complete
MPCKKCKDENYKYGNTGECKYATKEACEKANPKKYSKMQPTPLGKKTYEEYEKELKEFNLSSQRFEFNTQKELFALLDEFWKNFDNAVLPFDKVEGVLKGMIKSAEKAKSTANEYIKKAEQFNKQIKELGISEKEAKAGSYIKQKKEDIKSADNWIRVIKKFIADANNVD